MSFIENCRRFIALDSTPDSGTREVALYAAELCKEVGLKVTLQEEILYGVPQINVIARRSEEIPQNEFMLLSHLDTVDPGPYGLWKKTEGNPFNASIHGQVICGLGARTGKLDFLCKLEALKKFSKRDESGKRPFVLVGTFGNHLGMAGALKLIRRKMVNATSSCIGEPTGLLVADGGSGFAKLEITIPFSEEERSYHQEHDLMESGSTQSKMFRTYQGEGGQAENAIFKMLDYLERLPKGIAIMDIDGGVAHNIQPRSAVVEMDMVDTFKQGVISKLLLIRDEIRKLTDEFKLHPDDRFEKPFSTINVGRVYKQNHHVHLLGSCRLLPSVSSSTYENWLETLGRACRKIGATFRILDYKRPFLISESSPFLKSALQAQGELFGVDKAVKIVLGTEASVFDRIGTMDCIVFGAGKVDEEYSIPDESVSIDDLQKSIQFYERLIERVSL
ncbi:M20/M25/M40 family metallo-hydrolase [Bdellovibrionales bacterium]|nr:M20/M25/M40 family metallo-hydrolase [Bdellovibrionales bacterium]